MSASSTGVQSDTTGGDESILHSPSPGGSVPLHELCKNCSQFCGSWEVLDGLQRPDRVSLSRRSDYRLCTVEHLITSQNACHLCKFLLASVQRSKEFLFGSVSHLYVYLRTQQKEDGSDQYLHARVAEETPLDTERTMPFIKFLLKTDDCELLSPISLSFKMTEFRP